jgi:hypothetical protein
VGRREFPQTTSEGSSSAERRPAGCIDAFAAAASAEFLKKFLSHRIIYPGVMYEIQHNGIPRSYRDLQATAYDAARLGKARTPTDVIEIVDVTSGAKVVMHADGRTS